MNTQTVLQRELARELSSFQKTFEDLRLLKKASGDLRKLRKMALLKKFD
jgi:hypothetical protein